MNKLLMFGIFVVALAVSACGQSATALPNSPTLSASAPTAQVQSTATSAPAATSAPTATTAPKPAQANAPTGNPFDLILAAQRAQMNAKSWRTRTTTTGADGKTGTTLFEFVAPDRVHMAMPNGFEIIAIKGVGTYQKPPAGQWLKSPVDFSATYFAFMDPKTIEEFQKSIVVSAVKFVGPDLIDVKPMFVFQYATLVKGIGPNGSDIAGTSKMWVGVTDGLPYKLESEQDSAVTLGAKSHTVAVYDYDPTIKIEAPVK